MRDMLEKPHMILSVQNPLHSGTEAKHEDVVAHLRASGEKVHEAGGHYGGVGEKSMIISEPKNVEGIKAIAAKTGQDSIIHSDGTNHKLIYLNGPQKGKYVAGKGTEFFNEKPKGDHSHVDNPQGGKTYFTHNLDFDKTYEDKLKKNSLEEELFKVSEWYKKQVKEGIAMIHPVTINGKSHSSEDFPFHSTVKVFDKDKDRLSQAHEIARWRDFEPPDARRTTVRPVKLKDKSGEDVFAIELGGDANRLKDHNKSFQGMGFPTAYNYKPHITVDEETHDKLVSSGAKTAHEFGIKFGHAELRHGANTLKKYFPK